MSKVNDKCGDVLLGSSTGAVIGEMGDPVVSAIGAKIGGAAGGVIVLFSD